MNFFIFVGDIEKLYVLSYNRMYMKYDAVKGADILETPEYYRKLLDMAALTGTLMISSGAETHRVEDTMQRILSTSGFERAESMVFPTGFIVTLSDPRHESLSITKRVTGISNNLGRVADVNQVSREFCSGAITLDEAIEKLKAISNHRRYSLMIRVLGYILTGGGFCYVFGSTLPDVVGAVVCSFAIAFVDLFLGPKIGKGFITNILAGATITVAAAVVSYCVGQLFDIQLQAHYMIIGPIMLLVPGLAMTNAARDIVHGDYLSGGSRAIEAFCIAALVSVGVGVGMAIVNVCGFSDSLVLNFNLSVQTLPRFLGAVLASALAVCGFSILFEIQPKNMIFCGLSGMLSWAVYLVADYFGMSGVWATFCATLAVDLFSHIYARKLKTPVIIFLVTGLLPLVPGISVYKAVYAIMYGEGGAGQTLLGAILCVGAIALAIFLMDTMLDMEKRASNYIRSKKTKNGSR